MIFVSGACSSCGRQLIGPAPVFVVFHRAAGAELSGVAPYWLYESMLDIHANHGLCTTLTPAGLAERRTSDEA
jgi:hypothetical protein